MTTHDDGMARGLYDLKSLFADKWSLAIAAALRDGPRRWGDILSTCTSYSIDENWSDKPAVLQDSILARHLKKMRELGMVDRSRCSKSFPPEVVYTLNPEIVDLLKRMDLLIEWTRAHPALLKKAQAYSRHHGGGGGGRDVPGSRNAIDDDPDEPRTDHHDGARGASDRHRPADRRGVADRSGAVPTQRRHGSRFRAPAPDCHT